jgi:hypothetical protein
MMRLYGAQRRRGGANPLGVGTVAVGSLFYLQDQAFFSDRHGGRAVCKVPWQVEGFLNGMLHASRRDPDTGVWRDSFWSGRSDMAVVRSLRDGRRRTVAVRLLLLHADLGLTKGIAPYPTLPDLRLYRCRPRIAHPTPALVRAA